MAALDSGSSDYDSDTLDTAGTAESADVKTDWQRANGMTDAIVKMQNKLGVALDGSKANLATRLLVAMDEAGLLKLSDVIQVQYAEDAAVSAALTTNMVNDDGIPEKTEGDELLTLAITPKSATSRLIIEGVFHISAAAAEQLITAIFIDDTTNAIYAQQEPIAAADEIITVNVSHSLISGSTSTRTYKIRAGTVAQNIVMNGIVTGPGRKLGGVMISSLKITEWQV